MACLSGEDNGPETMGDEWPDFTVGNSDPDKNSGGPLHNSGPVTGDPIWDSVREEAKSEAEKEPMLSSFLYASILSHDSLEKALGFVLANHLQNPTLLAPQLMDIFCGVIFHDQGLQRSIRMDLQAFKDRDPSCLSYCSALLYLKAYHSLQTHRVAHSLWNQGRRVLALALQSRISELQKSERASFWMVLQPTGVVIGETAVIGDRVSLMQGVTLLGGTRKEHPKIGESCVIGAGATIIGNIIIGEGAIIAAGSLVLKNIPPHGMVAGIPAKVIGCVQDKDPSLTMKHDASKGYSEQVPVTCPETISGDEISMSS